MFFKNKAVLLIHGFAGGTYDEEYLSNYLETNSKFDVFTFTLPGHDVVFNAKVTASEWIDASCKQIEQLISFGYKDIYLIGHSMGGVIASYMASKYGEIKKLVLLAPSFEYLIFKDGNLDILESLKHTPELFKDYKSDVLISRIIKFPISVIKEFIDMVKEYNNCYMDIKVPTLIIHGDKDNIVSIKSSKNIYNKMSYSYKKLIVLKGINHDICRSKKKDIVNDAVERFLINYKKLGFDITEL